MRSGKVTQAKRNRERALQMKRKDKEAKRALRKEHNLAQRSLVDGEDPDLVGLKVGPQPPLF